MFNFVSTYVWRNPFAIDDIAAWRRHPPQRLWTRRPQSEGFGENSSEVLQRHDVGQVDLFSVLERRAYLVLQLGHLARVLDEEVHCSLERC